MNEQQSQATFRSMDEGTAQDWAVIADHFFPYASGLADRVLKHLKLLDGDYGGFPVDRLQHSLQTATRAHRAGESEDYVVAALLHDIGDTLGSYNHPDVAAAILKPFIDEKTHWIVEHHGIFRAITSSISLVSTATCASNSGAIRTSRTPPASARSTTRRRSTAITTRLLSNFSSRWCAESSRHRNAPSTLAMSQPPKGA
jgi:predicted HD phosphohydrolase